MSSERREGRERGGEKEKEREEENTTNVPARVCLGWVVWLMKPWADQCEMLCSVSVG